MLAPRCLQGPMFGDSLITLQSDLAEGPLLAAIIGVSEARGILITPAMAAGVADHVWNIEKIAALVG